MQPHAVGREGTAPGKRPTGFIIQFMQQMIYLYQSQVASPSILLPIRNIVLPGFLAVGPPMTPMGQPALLQDEQARVLAMKTESAAQPHESILSQSPLSLGKRNGTTPTSAHKCAFMAWSLVLMELEFS